MPDRFQALAAVESGFQDRLMNRFEVLIVWSETYVFLIKHTLFAPFTHSSSGSEDEAGEDKSIGACEASEPQKTKKTKQNKNTKQKKQQQQQK